MIRARPVVRWVTTCEALVLNVLLRFETRVLPFLLLKFNGPNLHVFKIDFAFYVINLSQIYVYLIVEISNSLTRSFRMWIATIYHFFYRFFHLKHEKLLKFNGSNLHVFKTDFTFYVINLLQIYVYSIVEISNSITRSFRMWIATIYQFFTGFFT